MNAPFKILAAAVCGLLLGLPAAQAEPLEYVYVNVGTVENELTIWPGQLTLEAGKLYRFDISNPSKNIRNPSKNIYVVAAPELAATVNTAELRIGGSLRLDQPLPALDMITRITLQPGQTIEWTFTPLRKGVYKFGCDDPVHAEAGMHTMIEVK